MISLWRHVYGEQRGILALFSGMRPEVGSKKLDDPRTAYFLWPNERERAREWVEGEARAGRETYHCAHLLNARRRIKDNAAPLLALYVDGDGAKVGPDTPNPTATVESSPGREQYYWRLTEPVDPELGERFNRRLAYAMGADKSGWDLTQLLRPPGTHNFKYKGAPKVQTVDLMEERHDPAKLDRLLPPLPEEEPKRTTSSHRPENVGTVLDLSRLSQRMQALIRFGNRGEYESRSEADMAACIAMFGVGFTEAEVWAVMSDPTNGISEKFFEKGRNGERYLSLTIGKAEARAQASPRLGRSKAYARRKGVVSLG